jgi:hypothetical protein
VKLDGVVALVGAACWPLGAVLIIDLSGCWGWVAVLRMQLGGMVALVGAGQAQRCVLS